MSGKEITVLLDKQLQAGDYEVKWNGANYPPGTYFYEFTSSAFEDTRYILLTK
jgi:hypothetical protein